MISIVDYGVGNVQALLNIYNRIGIKAQRASNTTNLNKSSHLILPGVGHFDHAIKKLNDSGLRDCLEDLVINFKVPLLGICVGMQVLANNSEEGSLPGLGWISGNVRAFSNHPKCNKLPLPHMGWNTLKIKKSTILSLEDNDQSPEFYFLHSYYFDTEVKSYVSGTSSFGFNFDAAVSYKNVHGVQFHPEKSHSWGEKLLKNFATI